MGQLSLTSAKDTASAGELQRLNARMAEFYNGPAMRDYYRFAQQSKEVWPADSHHHVVSQLCQPGLKVLDMGCGGGHAAANLRSRGVEYTGVDWSAEQVAVNNAKADPTERFISAPLYDVPLPNASFDIVFTFYVLEHLVWPHRFLHEMARLVRPGGWIVIECPHFRPNHRIPSLRYGSSVRPLAEKLRLWRFVDAARHYLARTYVYPRQIAAGYPRQRFPFLINLEPSCLTGTYYPDNDAVYFTDRDEIVAELQTFAFQDKTSTVYEAMRREQPADPLVIAAQKL